MFKAAGMMTQKNLLTDVSRQYPKLSLKMSHDPILRRRRRSRLARTIVRSADKKAPVDLSKVAAQRDNATVS